MKFNVIKITTSYFLYLFDLITNKFNLFGFKKMVEIISLFSFLNMNLNTDTKVNLLKIKRFKGIAC